MKNPEFDSLSRDFGRIASEALIPEDAVFYDEIIEAASRAPARRTDHELGFGASLQDIAFPVMLMSAGQFVMKAMWDAAQPAIQSVAKETAEELRKAFIEKLKEWLKRKMAGPAPHALSPEQSSSLTLQIESSARSMNISDDQIRSIVDFVRTKTSPKQD